MIRSVWVYGVLLVVSLGVAWVRWTAPAEPNTGDKVTVLYGDAKEIDRIYWKTKDDETVIERKTDDHGDYLWVESTHWTTKRKPPKPEAKPEKDAGEESAGDKATGDETEEAAEPERVAKKERFKAGDAAKELLDQLSPLLAIRRLDEIDDAKLADIGLDKPEGMLEITRKGRTRKLELGGESYGTHDRYVRDPTTGAIYLIDNDLFRPLKYARTRLPDRNLLSLKTQDIAQATIEGPDGKKLDVTQKNKDDRQKAEWVRAAKQDASDKQVDTWMDKVLRLRGVTYADPDNPPKDLELRFKLTVTNDKGEHETLDVEQEGPKGDWWARSEHTRAYVKLLRGQVSSLADDVKDLVEE